MTGIIVLCRYNSSRLPGKILKKIKGKEILTYIIERLSIIEPGYPIVVCTSVEKTDDPIVAHCVRNNIKYYRGDLNNVALRFMNCAQENGFENAVRINGDNIFLDANLIEKMIAITENNRMLFVSNVKGRTFPRGRSVEIVNMDFYKKEYPKFEDSDLEHVMTYFYRMNDENMKFVYNTGTNGGNINLAIDTKQDLKNANRIIESMDKDHTQYGYSEIIKLFDNTTHDA